MTTIAMPLTISGYADETKAGAGFVAQARERHGRLEIALNYLRGTDA
jgi:hypothetical protein